MGDIFAAYPARPAVEGQVERGEIAVRVRDADIAHIRADELRGVVAIERAAAHVGRGRLGGGGLPGEAAVAGEEHVRQNVVVGRAEHRDGRVVLIYRAAGYAVYMIPAAEGDLHALRPGVGGVDIGKAVAVAVDGKPAEGIHALAR